MLKLIRNKEGVAGFNCEKCSAWNPVTRGSKGSFVQVPSRFGFSCTSCGAVQEVAVKGAVGFKLKPYLCEKCGETTSSVRPRFEGTTAVLTCRHCGAETTQSLSDLKKSATAFSLKPYLCENCGKTTSMRPLRLEGTTAVVTCEHCGAETSRSISELN